MPSSPLMSDFGGHLAPDVGKVLSNLFRNFCHFVANRPQNVSFHRVLRQIMKESSMAARLDRVDLKMLRLLQNSGRLSNAELAEMVGVSPATCHRRTQRLFDEGFVGPV